MMENVYKKKIDTPIYFNLKISINTLKHSF